MAHFVKLENEKENQNENKENSNKVKEEKKEELQECMICFYDVDTEKTFIGCDTCGKQCHAKCYVDWFLQKNERQKCCISCQQPTLVYCEAKVSMMSRCYTSIFGGQPKIKKKILQNKLNN